YKAARAGIHTHLESAGYRYVVIDSHLAHAGKPLEAYHNGPTAAEEVPENSPYRDYTIGSSARAVHALVRDPASTHHVWSRDHGYPGAGAYLEFHKIRFPGGLKLWEVTGSGVSLGSKQPYDPVRARALAREHAGHFADLLTSVARSAGASDRVIVAPFDSELFGHWWFEGPDFIGDVYRSLSGRHDAIPISAGAHVERALAATPLDLPAGSWGRDGNFGMWLNEQTAWTWQRLWPLEERFWDIAPTALAMPAARAVLAQAARELLLAQSSDWQFIISTGEVADYAERRFRQHAEAAEMLVGAIERGDSEAAGERAAELQRRDSLFPDVLDSVARALLISAVTT
ncbi:MAG: 1,4-alpha-glucan branching protein domain-containing protein, partial [Gemmatimonadaceae bacterium]